MKLRTRWEKQGMNANVKQSKLDTASGADPLDITRRVPSEW